MKITYGIKDNVIDVTKLCKERLLTKNNIIVIPSGDSNRAKHFTDPIVGIKKKIFIENDGIISEYEDNLRIEINIINNSINIENIENKLENIHSKLKIKYGTMKEELPEQKMVIRYLKGEEKVLEIGGNIGRNSLVIASILKNSNDLVTLESDVNISKNLSENRLLNNMKFHIETSALSKRKLIQKGWDTKPSETLERNFKWVNTITLEQLKTKYNIKFDTLVLDCEGAFYYILMDMPEILDNINLIIMENDYHILEQKKYIDNILTKNNFYVDYTESGGWGPCCKNFFEVWKKNDILNVQR
jgi:FkbM family methyltransferase